MGMFEDSEKVKSFFDEGVKSMKKIVKQTCQLSVEESDLVYMRTFEEYNNRINDLNKSIQETIRILPKSLNCTPKWPPKLQNNDLKSENCDKELMETLIDVNDFMLDLFNQTLDEAIHGKVINETNLLDKYNLNTAPTNAVVNLKGIFKNETCHVKPQLQWKKKLSNDSDPFKPQLDIKPHALVSLNTTKEQLIHICDQERVIQLYEIHPYAYEIYQCKYDIKEYKKKYNQKVKNIRPLKDDLHYIDTVEQLKDFMSFITASNIREIAVDLEAHSMRSYLGFVCLMQLSTRKEDFIIDTIVLHDHLTLLNEIFANPNILKIFHGANSDIKWLQRDFNIYVVNMFDTYVASKRLPFARRSLAHLLQHYCDVDTDKSFQKADWRIRPLTDDMIKYARIDTHYLHYIYDRLVIDLLECDQNKGGVLSSVLNESRDVSLNVYEKPPVAAVALIKFKEKFTRNMSYIKVRCLEELYTWRQDIARKHDESPEYVLPQHMLLELANRLPRDKEGVTAYCTPLPPLLNEYIYQVCKIIKASYDEELNATKTLTAPVSSVDDKKVAPNKSLSKFLKLGNNGAEIAYKINPDYIADDDSSLSSIENLITNDVHFLSLKRQVYASKLANDVGNSFVNFYDLYKKSVSDK